MGGSTFAGRVGVGDRDAFAAMYEEFADPVFGTCVSILRDRDEAADATQDVFVLALQRIGQLRDPDRLRPWLFAIARHVCFRRLRERGRTQPIESVEPVVDLDDDADDALSTDDAAAVIWAAAAGLSERDRAVLYLNLVQGLEGDDLAAALGVKQANPHSLLYRAKTHLERAVGVLAVSRLGRRDCAALDALLAKWDGTLTPIVRKRVGRHIDECETCTGTKARAYKVPTLTAALLSVAGPAQALTGGAMFDIASRHPAARERWQRDGFPPLDERGRRRRRFALLSITALGVALLIVLLATTLGSADATPARQPAAVSPANAVAVPSTRQPAPSTTVAPAPATTLIAGITASTPTTARSVDGAAATQPGPPIITNAATVTATTVAAPVHNGPAPTHPPATAPPHKPPPPPPTTVPPPASTTTSTIHT